MPKLRLMIALTMWLTPAYGDAPLVVEVVTAQTAADTQQLALTGEIVARNALGASFASGGRVAEVFVDEGDIVAAGAPLARIESVQQEQALRSAEAGLATAQADQRQAVEDLRRQTSLLERGATTLILRDNAQDALNIAQGALMQAQAMLERAQKALDDTVLLAPQEATVTERAVEPGQVVSAAQAVFQLALGDGIDAVFDMPEVLLAGEGPATAVELSLIDRPGVTFHGETREVSPLVDPTTGTVAVTVAVTDPPGVVSYGDAVRGMVTRQRAPHIGLPHSAMSVTVDGPAVWVVDPQTMAVSLQQVTVDRYETGRIVLAGGLDDGTLVVARGSHLLYPGRVVQVAEDVK